MMDIDIDKDVEAKVVDEDGRILIDEISDHDIPVRPSSSHEISRESLEEPVQEISIALSSKCSIHRNAEVENHALVSDKTTVRSRKRWEMDEESIDLMDETFPFASGTSLVPVSATIDGCIVQPVLSHHKCIVLFQLCL